MPQPTVAYLGPQGTYTHLALLTAFTTPVTALPCRQLADIIKSVDTQQADYGVVPFENSTEGPVNQVLDALIDSAVVIQREISLPIQHCLMAADADQAIQTIVAHPQALAQCQQWLSEHYPHADLQAASSNAKATQMVKEMQGAAAIANKICADIYGLVVLAEHIEDDSTNTTRFFVLGKAASPPTGHDKTSLVFTIMHESGALSKILNLLGTHHINLTMLHSRPVKNNPWHYRFYIDMEGHQQEEPLKTALTALAEQVVEMQVLGSYAY